MIVDATDISEVLYETLTKASATPCGLTYVLDIALQRKRLSHVDRAGRVEADAAPRA